MVRSKKCDRGHIIHGSFQLLPNFIKGFSNIASPITSLQKKGGKFEWSPRRQEIFQDLKHILTSVPVLNIAYLDEYFVMCIDACKEGLNGVLTQKGNVVCYKSQKLKEHERNYATNYLELVAIVHVLKIWRYYLMGGKFELKANHCGLKHLFGYETLNFRQTRWIEFLCEYNFEIKHIKGK
jgi:hypothetical protein